jgi:hypothetical protein
MTPIVKNKGRQDVLLRPLGDKSIAQIEGIGRFSRGCGIFEQQSGPAVFDQQSAMDVLSNCFHNV